MQISLQNVIINKVETIGDGSMRIRLETRELPPEEMVKIFESLNKGEVELETESIEPNQKSKSQRLRSVLFVFWQQYKTSEGDFENYYNKQMEKIIDNIKEKLS